MNITPAIPTTNPLAQPGGSQLTNEPGKGKGACAGSVDEGHGADFGQKLQSVTPPQSPDAARAANPTAAVSQSNSVNGTQAVNADNAVPDKQDMFRQFDKVRSDLDSYMARTNQVDTMVADGTLKPNDPKVMQQHREEMRMLLHFQSEMQSSAVKIEIASKVVDSGTSGVKTVLQTQA